MVWAKLQHEGEDRRHGGRNAGEKGRGGDLGATLLSSSNKKGKPHTDLNHLSKALYKLQGQKEGVAGGLGTPQDTLPSDPPPPPPAQGKQDRKQLNSATGVKPSTGFQLPIHPPLKRNTRKHYTHPGGGHSRPGLLEAEAGDLLS